MKETFYFSHDYNSRSDGKIKLLIRKHGMCGYGCFWSIVEDLYQNANALRIDYEGIAYDLRVDKSIIESVINDFDLFIIDGDMFGSLSIERRFNERSIKSTKAKESANYRWEKHRQNANAPKIDANALQSKYKGNTIKESIEKESIEKGKKDSDIFISRDHLSITWGEMNNLIDKYGTEKATDTVNNILNYRKNSNYKSIYLTALKWIKKDLDTKKQNNRGSNGVLA